MRMGHSSIVLFATVMILASGLLIHPEASAVDPILDPSDPAAVLPLLSALLRNLQVRTTALNGEDVTLRMEVSSAFLKGPDGIVTLLESPSLGVLSRANSWSVILRGESADNSSLGALVVKPGGIFASIDLLGREHIQTKRPVASNGSMVFPTTIATTGPAFRAWRVVHPSLNSAIGSSLQSTTLASNEHARSVQLSKHIWDQASTSGQAIDPVNVLFYADVALASVFDNLMSNVFFHNGWDLAPAICRTVKYAHIWDARHGGTDGWQAENEDWKTEETICGGPRYHARLFFSTTGDTHQPGFKWYAASPVHWEDWGHALDVVYPQAGQDKLLSDIGNSEWVERVYFYQLADNNDCVTCPRWDGWIYIFWVDFPTSDDPDPCGGLSPRLMERSGTPKSLEWRCVSALFGEVNDQVTGAGISNANVRATSPSRVYFTTTEGDPSSGLYWIDDMVLDTYEVETWRCDYYSQSRTVNVYGSTVEIFQLQKKPTGTLVGYVRDSSDSSGIAGATVRENVCRGSTASNTNGYYSFTVIAGEQISVTASKSGYSSRTQYVTVPAGGSSRLDFSLNPSGGGGGSPFVAPWNGTDYALDNNILPKSEDFLREELNVDDYYRLHQPLVPKNGRYSLQVVEFEDEHTRLDRLGLLAVDHDEDVQIVVDREGRVHTFENPEPPERAVDNYGRHVREALTIEDGIYYEGWRGDFVDVSFGRVAASEVRLVLKADICRICKMSVDAYVFQNGTWHHVDTILPRIVFAWEVIDLSPYAPSDNLTIRLGTTRYHKLDVVGLDTSPEKALSVQEAPLVSAVHSETGAVLSSLLTEDGQYVNLTPGQKVSLEFEIPSAGDETRSFVFVASGFYTHKYQLYLGDDLAIEGLNARGTALLAETTDVFSWEVDIAFLVWHMGDGTTQDGWWFNHTYATEGEYTISVEIHYQDGHMSTVERRILIRQ